MDSELLNNLGLIDPSSLNNIEYAQKCVAIYEQTLKAMGHLPTEPVSKSVDNLHLAYTNCLDIEDHYVNISEHY